MNNKFSNEKILKETLPKFEEIITSKLNSKYYSVTVISSIIVFSVLSTILGLAFNFLDFDWFENYTNTIIMLYLFVWVLLFFYDWISFNRKSYAFRDHDVIYKYGVLWQTSVLIPFNRIQHIALHQDFISRRFGLASLQFYTAGGSASDINIYGLTLDDAKRFKDFVSKRIEKKK